MVAAKKPPKNEQLFPKGKATKSALTKRPKSYERRRARIQAILKRTATARAAIDAILNG